MAPSSTAVARVLAARRGDQHSRTVCITSQELVTQTGFSRRSVFRALKELECLGFIDRHWHRPDFALEQTPLTITVKGEGGGVL